MSLIENLRHQYDDFLIDIPRWQLPNEGISSLQGPSGSGKTSVIRLLLGLDACPGLVWKIGGVDIAQLPVREKKLGVVFQSLDLFPHMNAEQNWLFGRESRGLDLSAPIVKEIPRRLKIDGLAKQSVMTMSGGERQRVALARALLLEPRFLFLDEPFSALDIELRSTARALVREVIGSMKIPTLLITHDPEDVRELSDHQFRIHHGKLV